MLTGPLRLWLTLFETILPIPTHFTFHDMRWSITALSVHLGLSWHDISSIADCIRPFIMYCSHKSCNWICKQ